MKKPISHQNFFKIDFAINNNLNKKIKTKYKLNSRMNKMN